MSIRPRAGGRCGKSPLRAARASPYQASLHRRASRRAAQKIHLAFRRGVERLATQRPKAWIQRPIAWIQRPIAWTQRPIAWTQRPIACRALRAVVPCFLGGFRFDVRDSHPPSRVRRCGFRTRPTTIPSSACVRNEKCLETSCWRAPSRSRREARDLPASRRLGRTPRPCRSCRRRTC